MSPLRARRLLFVLLFLTAPFPMLGPFESFVPAVRFWMLAAAASAVALAEGGAGPVPAIIALIAANAIAATIAAWLGAWLVARLLGGVSAAARSRLVLGGSLAWVLVATLVRVYRTGFGPEMHTTLVGVFQ